MFKRKPWKPVHITMKLGRLAALMLILILPLPQEAFVHAQGQEMGKIAYVGRDGNVWLMNADGGEKYQITSDAFYTKDSSGLIVASVDYWDPAWSPDGKRLAFVRRESAGGGTPDRYALFVWSEGEEMPKRLVEGARFPTWSHDGRLIAYEKHPCCCWWGPEGHQSPDALGIWVVDTITGEARTLVPSRSGICLTDPSWSPSGRYIAFHEATYEGAGPFGIFSLDSGEYSMWTQGVGTFDWSPDGTRLVFDDVTYLQDEGRIRTANADGTGSYPLVNEPGKLAMDALWSPDGKTIAFEVSQWPPLPEKPDSVVGIWAVNSDGTNSRKLTPFDGRPVTWSPDSTRLLAECHPSFQYAGPDCNWGIFLVNVDGSGFRVIGEGGDPAWQPQPTFAVSNLLEEKHSLMPSLSSPIYDFLGVSLPAPGYDEASSKRLLARFEERHKGGQLSPSDVSAFQRVVLVEQALASLYPHYARSADDTSDAAVTTFMVGFGLVKALTMVEARLGTDPFSAAARQLLLRIQEKTIDLLNRIATQVEYSIKDDYQRETFRMLREGTWKAVKIKIMEAEEPFGETGETFLEAFSDVTLKPALARILLSRYAERTQPIIEKAVNTADPDYQGADVHVVLPTDEKARAQAESVVNQVKIWSEYHHETYEDPKVTANIPALASDLADVASLTGVVSPIFQVVARAADVMELMLVGYGGAKSWQFLTCLNDAAFDAERRIYDPNIPVDDIPLSCERARRFGLFSPVRGGALPDPRVRATLQESAGRYEEILGQVLESVKRNDIETAVTLIPDLIAADETLSSDLAVAQAYVLPILDESGLEESNQQLYHQGLALEWDTLRLYASLFDAVMKPDSQAAQQEVLAQGESVVRALESYVGTIGSIRQIEEKQTEPLVVISSYSLPKDIKAGEWFTLEIKVTNAGSRPASNVSVGISDADGLMVTSDEVFVGDMEPQVERKTIFKLMAREYRTYLVTVEARLDTSQVDSRSLLIGVALSANIGLRIVSSIASRATLACVGIGMGAGAVTICCLLVFKWGHRRAPAPARPLAKICPFCQAPNSENNRFCIKCGERLGLVN